MKISKISRHAVFICIIVAASGANSGESAKRDDARREIEELEADPAFLSFVAESRREWAKSEMTGFAKIFPEFAGPKDVGVPPRTGPITGNDWKRLSAKQFTTLCEKHASNSQARVLYADYLWNWASRQSFDGLEADRHAGFQRAEKVYREALKLNPANTDALRGLADCLRELDKPDEEIAVREELARLASAAPKRDWREEFDEQNARYSRHGSFSRLKATADLVETLERASKLTEAARTLKRLLDSLVTITVSKDGKETTEKWAASEDELQGLQASYAKICAKLGNYQDAIAAAYEGMGFDSGGGGMMLEKDLENRPFIIGLRTALTGDLKAAVAKFREAIVSAPADAEMGIFDSASAFYNLGFISLRQKKFHDAIEAFQKAGSFAGTRPKLKDGHDPWGEDDLRKIRGLALIGEAVARWKSGDTEEAKKTVNAWLRESAE